MAERFFIHALNAQHRSWVSDWCQSKGRRAISCGRRVQNIQMLKSCQPGFENLTHCAIGLRIESAVPRQHACDRADTLKSRSLAGAATALPVRSREQNIPMRPVPGRSEETAGAQTVCTKLGGPPVPRNTAPTTTRARRYPRSEGGCGMCLAGHSNLWVTQTYIEVTRMRRSLSWNCYRNWYGGRYSGSRSGER